MPKLSVLTEGCFRTDINACKIKKKSPRKTTCAVWLGYLDCKSAEGTIYSALMLGLSLRTSLTRAQRALVRRTLVLVRRPQPKQKTPMNGGFFIGWDTWTRTKICGVRVRCSTIKLYPNRMGLLYAPRTKNQVFFTKCLYHTSEAATNKRISSGSGTDHSIYFPLVG